MKSLIENIIRINEIIKGSEYQSGYGPGLDDLYRGLEKFFDKSTEKTLERRFGKVGKAAESAASEYVDRMFAQGNLEAIRSLIKELAKNSSDFAEKYVNVNKNEMNLLVGQLGDEGRKVIRRSFGDEIANFYDKFIWPKPKMVDGIIDIMRRNTLTNCLNARNCPELTAAKSRLRNKLNNLNSKFSNKKFYPSDIKLYEKVTCCPGVDGSLREIIDVKLPDGERYIFFKSSGSNTATTGKEKNTWYVTPGFSTQGWFSKDEELISFTKKGTPYPYLYQMAEYMFANGTNGFR